MPAAAGGRQAGAPPPRGAAIAIGAELEGSGVHAAIGAHEGGHADGRQHGVRQGEGGAAGRQTAAAAGRRRRGEARGKAADTEVCSVPRRAARLFQTAAEAGGKAADTEVCSARARPARRQPLAA